MFLSRLSENEDDIVLSFLAIKVTIDIKNIKHKT